ncbi:hypothetical protein [Olsenella sp. kh2p3]|uniref:hypothetical protein n=1 Tax=Olsenella sp. kh2p3 TaxID=1797112 RepID=UPI00091C79BD|nr:hypothetical protein [Olsenella sp. kh2p3]SFX64466.1 hypothetical protein SAMN04487823_1193 [Olsenella sp. kh2p3]
MALYWPEAKVALEIVDDPASKPYEGPADWSVLHVTCEDIRDVRRFQEMGRKLGRLLGEDTSFMDDPEWQRGNAELHERLMNEFCPR